MNRNRTGRREFLFAVGTALFVPLNTPSLTAQFTSSVRVVNVFVTVRDKQGHLVQGLKQTDFQLAEDGRPQTIRYFSDQSDLPLTLGLLFDLSGSQRAVIEQQRRASATFLQQVLRSADQALILGFNRSVQLLQPLTHSQSDLAQGLAKLDVSRTTDGKLNQNAQGTALFDAVAVATRIFELEPGRKAMVILSDGIDTASNLKLDAAIAAAQRADTLLYPIRFYDRQVFAFDIQTAATEQLRAGKRALQKLAEQTGGSLLEITDADTLETNFARIDEELRHQYSLGFTPANTRTGYRKLRVRLTGQANTRGLTIQSRDGYFSD